MTAARNYWVCSTRPDGRPHAAPVWGLWLDAALYFSTDSHSVKGLNLAARPDVAIHLESGDEVVMLEGRVELVTARDELRLFVDAYNTKYQFRPNVEDTSGSGVHYRVKLAKVLAWQEKDFPASATRWQFDA